MRFFFAQLITYNKSESEDSIKYMFTISFICIRLLSTTSIINDTSHTFITISPAWRDNLSKVFSYEKELYSRQDKPFITRA